MLHFSIIIYHVKQRLVAHNSVGNKTKTETGLVIRLRSQTPKTAENIQ